MTSSLVGSEMCIRDSPQDCPGASISSARPQRSPGANIPIASPQTSKSCPCLLYTSDAADDM
eukprot:10731170-Prorocentrum_lima.AAC.1